MAQGALKNSRAFAFISCLMIYIASFVSQLFGYANNDWFYQIEGNVKYMRGFGVDCVNRNRTVLTVQCHRWLEINETGTVDRIFASFSDHAHGWSHVRWLMFLGMGYSMAGAIISFVMCCFGTAEKALSKRPQAQLLFYVFSGQCAVVLISFLYMALVLGRHPVLIGSKDDQNVHFGFGFVQYMVIGEFLYIAASVILFFPVIKFLLRKGSHVPISSVVGGEVELPSVGRL